jgi:uncharacterized membrane protein
MQAKARILGHPIHQILIVYPLGLLSTSLIFDLIGAATHHGFWNLMAFYLIAFGVIGGLVAAIFGLIDWLAIPGGTRARQVGLLHAGANVAALVFFAASWFMRCGHTIIPGRTAIILSIVGFGIIGAAGWLGGELVTRHAVGVDDGANLDAPGSLSRR